CAAILALSFAADAEYSADVSPAIEIIRAKTKLYKSLSPAGSAGFRKDEFISLLGDGTEHVVLLTLPVSGELTLNGVPLETDQPIKTDMLPKMIYSAPGAEGTAGFFFKDASRTNSSALECVINVCADPTPPECGDIDLKTYRDVMIPVTLSASDGVEIMSAPQNGVLTLSGRTAIYRPKTGFEGKDSFTYRLKGEGGVSRTAKVNVNVEKPFNNLFFADMKDSPDHKAAIDLYRYTSLEPEKDGFSNFIFAPDELIEAEEAQRVLREADPDAGEPVLLLPEEKMTKLELARLVSARAEAAKGAEKDFFGRLREFFGAND
ncbi:MAG: hypothetical protein IJV00_01975, partial [Clostridia bacterium]|nr:hypothetical protein [Clostridia bacterium]